MRKGIATFAVLTALTITMNAHAQFSSVSYSVANLGANTLETTGDFNAAGRAPVLTGYARVQPASSTTPAGAAILGFRQNGVLVSETGMPAVNAIISGRTFAEVNGTINTGLAFVNPNSFAVVVSFSLTDQFGNEFGPNTFSIGGNAQITKFLNEFPFNVRRVFAGALTFNASAPVGVTALRTLVNQRGESLATTQTVAPLPSSISAGTLLLAHFADGGGWRTKVILLNTTDGDVSGTVEFLGEGSPIDAAVPLLLNVNGATATSFAYTVRARSSASLETLERFGTTVQVGSVRITPASGSTSPAAFGVFSFSSNGVVISQATVEARPPSTVFRSYVELSSTTPLSGAIQAGIAIANNSAANGVINFELTTLDGLSTGLTASVRIAGFGHVSGFLNQLFPTMPVPFRGMLRISSFNSMAVVSLRSRYNERGDFLMATLPASNEAGTSSTAELLFPDIADQGGFRTQFILFSGITDQSSTGTLKFFRQDGLPLNLTFR